MTWAGPFMGGGCDDLKVGTTERPKTGSAATKLILVGDIDSTIGNTVWNYLPAVMHGTWYALAQSVLQPPQEPTTPGRSTPSPSV